MPHDTRWWLRATTVQCQGLEAYALSHPQRGVQLAGMLAMLHLLLGFPFTPHDPDLSFRAS